MHAHVERAGARPRGDDGSGGSDGAGGGDGVGEVRGVRGLRPRPTFAHETWIEDAARLSARGADAPTWDDGGSDEVRQDAGAGTAADPEQDPAADVVADPEQDRAFAMRLGLAPIRGIGEATAARIVAARDERPFADAADLACRARLSSRQLESLATAGALRAFGGSRRQALWAAGALAGEAGRTHHATGGTWVQEVLAGTAVGASAPVMPEMDAVETAVADVWASGLSPEHHPTHFARGRLRSQGVRPVSSLVAVDDGVRVEVGGVVTHRQRPGTAQGVTFLALEDETGMLNVVCSAGLWARHRRTAIRSRALVVRGTIERTDGVVNLLADGMRPLRLAVATSSRDFQ
nr:OB-fold nucleic acid binding domain-containing protein [Litorihabitans aurantiacus]